MFLRSFSSEIALFPKGTTFVDLFGGSGLLSRACRDIHPTSRVIYNDYDDYTNRLALISATELLRQRLLPLVADTEKGKRIPPKTAQQIVDELRKFEQEERVIDTITVSTWLLYTMHFFSTTEELEGLRLYNSVPTTPIPPAKDYLNGLEVRHEDYRVLFQEFADDPTSVFLLDPPYLATNTNQYKLYWSLEDYLGVVEMLLDRRFVYFGSGRSDFVPFLDWAERKMGARNPFARAVKYERSNSTNAYNTYTDVMYVVR